MGKSNFKALVQACFVRGVSVVVRYPLIYINGIRFEFPRGCQEMRKIIEQRPIIKGYV